MPGRPRTPLGKRRGKGTLVLPHRLGATGLLEVLQRGREPGYSMGVEGPRLKARRPALRLQWLEGADARAAHVPRAHINALRYRQAARPLRPHEALVSGEADDVRTYLAHVYGDAARRLRGVHDEKCARLVGNLGNASQVNDIAGHV